MAFDVAHEAQVQGLNLGLKAITGEFSDVNRFDDYTELVLSQNQILHGQQFFRELLEKEPGAIRFVNTEQIFIPVLWKKYWMYLAGAVLSGAVLYAIIRR